MRGKKSQTTSKLRNANFRKNMNQVTKFNIFSTNVPLLYPLKTSENRKFYNVFKECRIGILVENGLNNTSEPKTTRKKNKKETLKPNK